MNDGWMSLVHMRMSKNAIDVASHQGFSIDFCDLKMIIQLIMRNTDDMLTQCYTNFQHYFTIIST